MSDEEEQGEFPGFVPTEVKEIRDAAQRLWRAREDAKDVKKTLKEKDEQLVANLAETLEKHKQEACKAGPYLIMVESKSKITVKRKKEKKAERKEFPSRN